MKVGPHNKMSLEEIILSKQKEQQEHKVHFWGYSGVFCTPKKTQEFCKWAKETYQEEPTLILLETKSSYESNIGFIKKYSTDNINFQNFSKPVQLQGAQYSFVAKNMKKTTIKLSDYTVVSGKNNGQPLDKHLRFRINKSFAQLNQKFHTDSPQISVYSATLVPPYAIWLKEE